MASSVAIAEDLVSISSHACMVSGEQIEDRSEGNNVIATIRGTVLTIVSIMRKFEKMVTSAALLCSKLGQHFMTV